MGFRKITPVRVEHGPGWGGVGWERGEEATEGVGRLCGRLELRQGRKRAAPPRATQDQWDMVTDGGREARGMEDGGKDATQVSEW